MGVALAIASSFSLAVQLEDFALKQISSPLFFRLCHFRPSFPSLSSSNKRQSTTEATFSKVKRPCNGRPADVK